MAGVVAVMVLVLVLRAAPAGVEPGARPQQARRLARLTREEEAVDLVTVGRRQMARQAPPAS